MDQRMIQWHSGFQAILELELSQDRGQLEFHREFNLSKKPLQIDTLIIRTHSEYEIRKSIGRMFLKYNVIEYKSPGDYTSIRDFFKVMGYACILLADSGKASAVSSGEITITFMGSLYPVRLAGYLAACLRAAVEREYPGIYYVTGLMFPVQIVNLRDLPKSKFVWLSRLRPDLDVNADMKPLMREYKGKEHDPLYAAAMDLIIRANAETIKDLGAMCDALRELFSEELEQRRLEGRKEGLELGRAGSILDLLSDLGTVSMALQDRILGQKDLNVLTDWLKLAARADDIETFEHGISGTGR